MGDQTFDTIESLEPDNKGARLYRRGQWVGTVWHSNIWGWQWARLAVEGAPLVGGKCSCLADGLSKVRGEIVITHDDIFITGNVPDVISWSAPLNWQDDAGPLTQEQFEAAAKWAKQ